MKFEISENSRYPAHEQIKEQIKLAISLGHIKAGYSLPSIRDLEKQLGVGRAIVYRAYRELEQSGIVTLQPRSGAVVSRKIVLPTSNHKAEHCEVLLRKVLREIKKIGVLESSFATLLYQRTMAREQTGPPVAFVESIKTEALQCAAQVSRDWGTNVVGISLDELKRIKRSDVSFRWLLTPFYEYEWVARVAKGLRIEAAPVVLTFSEEFIAELTSVLREGRALILLADQDFERHGEQLIAELRESVGPDLSRQLLAKAVTSVRSIESVVSSGKYKRVYAGNRIWDSLDNRIKELPSVGHPGVEIDRESLQQAKVKLGLLI